MPIVAFSIPGLSASMRANFGAVLPGECFLEKTIAEKLSNAADEASRSRRSVNR
jgi:hypothetical protein